MTAKGQQPASAAISLPRLNLQHLELTLVGDSPLICHAWSEKAKKQMLDKQMKKARIAKEAKDPKKDFEESLYAYPGGGYGFPVIAFKAAAVDACSHVQGVTKVEARRGMARQGRHGGARYGKARPGQAWCGRT